MFMEQMSAAWMLQSSLQGRIHGVLRNKYPVLYGLESVVK